MHSNMQAGPKAYGSERFGWVRVQGWRYVHLMILKVLENVKGNG